MRPFHLSHSPIDFVFTPSPRDFVVREIPLYEFSNDGEHAIIQIRKKNLTTFAMIKILSEVVGIKSRDIGYAGLKDKNASTYQHISIHKKFLPKLLELESVLYEKNIKVISHTFHNNKLRIGHLKGNEFFIRLKKVDKLNAQKIDKVLEILSSSGMPNYFGDQRFGTDGMNYEEGRKIAQNMSEVKNHKMSKFLLSSYQSYLFNQWLEDRMKLSLITNTFKDSKREEALNMELGENIDVARQDQFFKLLDGDIMEHYPYGKAYVLENIEEEARRFANRDVSPTGLICGQKAIKSINIAQKIESKYIDLNLKENGSRRYAWVWPSDISGRYIKEEAQFELEFSLPKGSYATIFLEALQNKTSDI